MTENISKELNIAKSFTVKEIHWKSEYIKYIPIWTVGFFGAWITEEQRLKIIL